jgi:hypothetical protein
VAARIVDGILVSLRFLPGRDDLMAMTFDLVGAPGPGVLELPFDGRPLAGCDIVFERTDTGTEVTAEAIGRDGLRYRVEVTRDVALALSFGPVFVFQSLALRDVRLARWDGQAPSEFWCDASVRTLYRKVNPDAQDGLELSAFPFEWLFSDEAGTARTERVIGEADLAQLREVEARIISVSAAMVIDTR